MNGSGNDTLQDIITAAISLFVGLGSFLVTKWIDIRNTAQKAKESDSQIKINEEKAGDDALMDTVGATQKLADILMNVVTPLSNRVTLLESDSLEKTKLIMELNAKIASLTKTILDKDVEIAELDRKYKNQVLISESQERKIQAQAMRIGELEDELKQMKKGR